MDLIAIWGEERRTVATIAKGTKRNQQNQAVHERIVVQMVARGHQRDWLQTIFLSPITDPGTQETQEVDSGQDGGSPNDTDIEHPAENLSGNPTLRRAASASSSTDGAAWPQVDNPSPREI
ncbi:hypothetical protein Y1Q_0007676 [Alligator mississippiensis]|uniref:Uncharacterized protein n=1 Tax=Alligator mississippiensis TaxID=8496 RepID=A0A151LY60_ALLMI|nr:hypothetical protein Y1Q_0007676 [Alligator mississippiensis]